MATSFSNSLTCSRHSFSSSRQFKSPAIRSRVQGKGTPQSPLSFESHGKQSEIPKQNSCATFHKRRGLILSTTLSFLLEGIGVNALGVDAGKSPIILDEIRKVLSKAKAPGVLRLVFHDAGTYDMDENSGGMNGSIIYELDRPENVGLNKSVKILEKAKSEVRMIQPASWADMIAMAGAEAVLLCGGPAIPVQLGRLDSMVPDPQGRLPLESLDASGLKKCFLKKGFSRMEAEMERADKTNTRWNENE